MGLCIRLSCSSETNIFSFDCGSQSGSCSCSIPFSIRLRTDKVLMLPSLHTWSKSMSLVRCKSSSRSFRKIFVQSTSASWLNAFSCRLSDSISGHNCAVCTTSCQSVKPQLPKLICFRWRKEGASSTTCLSVGTSKRFELQSTIIIKNCFRLENQEHVPQVQAVEQRQLLRYASHNFPVPDESMAYIERS